ncbi:uncharacterized protein LOC135828675 [Sycon ciliatum]|uniref:uncharacterized protein LOC135828675 n=1 Tax=Sycon ciliatum TaxID=27933 RepID=UPI0031F6303D
MSVSRYVPDLQARRKSSKAGTPDAIPHLVEPPKPPATEEPERSSSTMEKRTTPGRRLPSVPNGQLQTSSVPLSKKSGPSLLATVDSNKTDAQPSPTRTRRYGSHAAPPPLTQLQPAKTPTGSARTSVSDCKIAEELETSSGSFVVPDDLLSPPTASPTRHGREKKFSLPSGPAPIMSKHSAPVLTRRPSHGSGLGPALARQSRTSTTRKASVRKTSTICSGSLKEQLTMRLDIHLHSFSLIQSRSALSRQRRVDFSKCSVNVSASLGPRVDTSAPFYLEKEVQTSPRTLGPQEDTFSASLQQAISLPIVVGVSNDNPERYLSKDIRLTMEYGKRDYLTQSNGIGEVKWCPLATGSLDPTEIMKSGVTRFSQQQSVQMTMHQAQSGTTSRCVLDCTIIGTILQRKHDSEIDTTEKFSFDEEVFEFHSDIDDDYDSEDAHSSGDEVPDGADKLHSAPAKRHVRKSGASAIAMRAVGAQKKSIVPRRTSRVSATDAPSEMGADPMHTTAAFAYEGEFNRLGLLHVSVCSMKCNNAMAGTAQAPSRKQLSDGEKVILSAEINGGLTKQRSKPAVFTSGMPLTWDSKQPQFTFYTLKSRQIFLSLYSAQPGSKAIVKEKDVNLHGLANVPLNSVTELSDKLPLTYAQPAPMTFVENDTSLQTEATVTPIGKAAVNVAFISLPERQPCCGCLKARALSTSGLDVAKDIKQISCALKVDGVFKGMSSESEVSAQGVSTWPHDQLCEVSASDAVDLELHLWARCNLTRKWLGCGVLPIGLALRRQVEAKGSTSSTPNNSGSDYGRAIKQELWIPLEPQGFVLVEVWISDSLNLSSSKETAASVNNEETDIARKPDSQSDVTSGQALTESAKENLDGTTGAGTRKKSDPKWEDLLLVLKDRVELRKEVEFLHETLRSTKAKLAESEFMRAKLELENRKLHDRLNSAKSHTKEMARKATNLELRQLVLTSQEMEENGYSTA